MNILALDLGTETGWALSRDGAVTAGTWTLATREEVAAARKLRMDRRCDIRFTRLCKNLKEFFPPFSRDGLDWVVFEDVEFVRSRMQAHLWATWRAAVWTTAALGAEIDCLATGKLKKFATGNGGADKDQMARALTLDPRYELDKEGIHDKLMDVILDDNAVDAVHLLRWARQTFTT